MNLLTVSAITEARQKLLDCAANLKPRAERAGLTEAAGRILAEDLLALDDIPGFCRSTVDGYAVIAADTAAAGESLPVFLKLVGRVEMGTPANFAVRHGECAYVPTGGMIPGGADAVVMVEYCELFDQTGVAVYRSAASGSGVALAGEDARKGDALLRRGAKIRANEAGALAAAGIDSVPVYAPLRLTLISSGDELVPPAESPGPGQVRDVNRFALEALASQSGYRVATSFLLRDDEAALEAAVREALPSSDVIALSGGSSQGAKDLTAAVFSRVARPGVFCHGLAVKPGKPAILAYDSVSDTILAGLPGHPVSALMVFRMLFVWLARTLTGQRDPPPVPAKMACNTAGAPGRETWLPVALTPNETGYTAEPVFGKSGMIRTLCGADGYVIIGLNKEGLRKDEDVWVHLWEI
jgi:molybdopterin molybdotransferase